MLFSVEQAFVGRNEKRDPLKTRAWEASADCEAWKIFPIQEKPLKHHSKLEKNVIVVRKINQGI